MTTSIKRLQKGFTLIELLTVIAIIGILAAIIIPTVGKVRETARRSVDSSNLRQIGQAAQIYATDNRDQYPKWINVTSGNAAFGTASLTATGETVDGFAAALAIGGGLNDANIWISAGDATVATPATNASASTVLNAARNGFLAGFEANNALAFGVTLGLNASDGSTTPIAFTRGILKSGTEKWDATTGLYKEDGGHIVFLGGNVGFFRNLAAGNANGDLINTNGDPTKLITDTIKGTNRKMVEESNTGGLGTTKAATGK